MYKELEYLSNLVDILSNSDTIRVFLLEHKYTAASNGNSVVTTSSGLILAENSNRRYALITNDSDTIIYLALGGAAEVNKGIRLNANGGSYEINWTNRYTGSIYAIHGGTGNKLTIWTEGT